MLSFADEVATAGATGCAAAGGALNWGVKNPRFAPAPRLLAATGPATGAHSALRLLTLPSLSRLP
jgi:hypothetical protein